MVSGQIFWSGYLFLKTGIDCVPGVYPGFYHSDLLFLSWPLRWYLEVMEGPIPYTLPGDFLYSRLIFLFMGVALLALTCRRSKT